jgi:hypothetical protein
VVIESVVDVLELVETDVLWEVELVDIEVELEVEEVLVD